jgi:hypothetical protein
MRSTPDQRLHVHSRTERVSKSKRNGSRLLTHCLSALTHTLPVVSTVDAVPVQHETSSQAFVSYIGIDRQFNFQPILSRLCVANTTKHTKCPASICCIQGIQILRIPQFSASSAHSTALNLRMAYHLGLPQKPQPPRPSCTASPSLAPDIPRPQPLNSPLLTHLTGKKSSKILDKERGSAIDVSPC